MFCSVFVNSNPAVLRSQNPLPDAFTRSVLTPEGAKVLPEGTNVTSEREVT